MPGILVTGGSGYFGSLLAERLTAAGERCRLFDLVAPDEVAEGSEFVWGDVRDKTAIRSACEGIDVLYHCVAQVPLARDRELFDSVNIEGARNTLEAAHEAGVRKVVLLSSSAVFGRPAHNPVTEETPPRPVEAYGRAKLEAERVARRFHDERGLPISIIRPRTILGHGRLGIFQLLFDWVADGRSAYVLGQGDNVYQFVHAEDLAEASIRAAERDGFSIYNIGGRSPCSMRESLEGLARHAGTGCRIRSLPKGPAVLAMRALSQARLAPFAAYHWLMYAESLYFDGSRARDELGFEPHWANVEMLCQSYDWYLAHREQVKASVDRSAHRSPVQEGVLRALRWMS
jgi:nucleoside-diphosphate-sugar epimerase